MPLNTDEPMCDDKLLMDLRALMARHSYMFTGFSIGREFYRGWLPDFIAACDSIDQLLGEEKRGFHFSQIKEKLGWARYYWRTDRLKPSRLSLISDSRVLEGQLGLESTDDIEQKIFRILLAAEEASRRKCIVCSQPAEVRLFGGWFVCACERHSPDVIGQDCLLHAARLGEVTESPQASRQ